MPPSQDKKAALIRSIFTEHFGIGSGGLDWDRPLEERDERFKLLGTWYSWSSCCRRNFKKKCPCSKIICTAFHTPADILELVANNTLKNNWP